MPRTGPEIEKDVFDIIAASSLKDKVNGSVYKKDERPKDSQREDIVVKFVSGLPKQKETGSVAILIYVRDVDLYGDGTLREDSPRIEQLARHAADWAEDIRLRSIELGYKFVLMFTINAQEAPDNIHQHFISIRLHYEAMGKN